jgi:6-phosphogluconolactonase
MKHWSLHVTAFALLVAGLGCGGGSAPNAVTIPPVPSCTPSSKPAFAYALDGAIQAGGDGAISTYTVDSCTGALTPSAPATVATGSDPEDMAVDPSGRFAYAANLVSNASDEATISMYTINPTTGTLTPTNPPTVPTGFFPQGIAIDPLGRFVYTANSDDNTVSMFTINKSTGVLTPTTPPAVAAGWSPDGLRVDPSGRFVYVTNQDDDTVSMYTIDQTTGVLTPTSPATVPTGFSPFEITVDPAGKFAYVPNTYDTRNIVSEYTIDSSSGVLTPTETATAGNQPTFVAIDPSSKFAFVVNRYDQTISEYRIDSSTGALTPNGTTGAGAAWWRAAVDPSGKFVYATGASGGIAILNLSSDGTLTSAGSVSTPSAAYAISVVSTQQ